MLTNQPQTIYLKDYTPPTYLITQVDLDFNLSDEQTKVIAQLTLKRNPANASNDNTLLLNGENLTLHRVLLNDVELSPEQYSQTSDSLAVSNLPQEHSFVLTIENSIQPNANTALEGLYASNGMLCTQCEAEGFRKITYFLDRPDVMAQFTTTLTADKTLYPVLLSNGNKIASGDLENNQHWVRWEDPFAKPCYLFALVAGQLSCVEDSFTTCSGRNIALQIFVEAHDADKCAHAMHALQQSMLWDEQVYGREYDLDLYMIVAVSHFNMGAMENKGLNVFNTKFVLARTDTATDADYEHVAGVIAHEYFHNWSGNRVTCRDWFQLSLKEGFTVFRDQEFSGDHGSKAVKRIEDVNMLRTRQFAEDAGPLAHSIRPNSYIEINNFYTVTVYEKGAEVVRMLHTLLGAAGFRKACDLYFDRHDGQAVTCDDFVNALEDANGVDLSQFRRWYAQAGTPVLTVTQDYDAQTQSLTLHISQQCHALGKAQTEPLLIPIKLGLLYADGSVAPIIQNEDPARDEVILSLTQTEQCFVFTGLREQPVVSLLRGFSAPVKLVMERSTQELAFLLSHDSDTFNRWEAGQQLSAKLIAGLIADYQNGRELILQPVLVEAFSKLLAQHFDDLSYCALLLGLPAENYLAELMTVVDVVAIHQAREFVIAQLAQHLQHDFSRLYETLQQAETGALDASSIGRRRLKNLCLSYLSRLENTEVQHWAKQQFDNAPTMTDSIGALTVIVNNPHPAKADCLAQFYQKWRDEALVVDKWFALQASSMASDAFAVVQSLLSHPAFDLKNPNRVRSLIGAFSQANPLHFHAASGQGYAFLAEQIIALNAINPQVASRMLNPLTTWRRYDESRQAMMRAQLERVMTTPNISRDVYEVASKSLA
ncbi:MAG: aminopeptidase N [Methylococcaceae bacterium]